MQLAFSHQKSAHRMWTVDEINGVSVESELMHLQGGTIIKPWGKEESVHILRPRSSGVA